MISIKRISKQFKTGLFSTTTVLDDVSFSCESSGVTGLVGPNGAGKTTLLRILSTALKPTSGTAEIAGFDICTDSIAVRRKVGFMTTTSALYGRLTAHENLMFFGRLYGMSTKYTESRINEMSKMLDMGDYLNKRCDKLSLGMKQKTNIARVLLHNPEVIILDEPTTGLDVMSRRVILDFIRDSRESGKTVLLSSHLMNEIEDLCDKISIIYKGKIYFSDTLKHFKTEFGENLEEGFVNCISTENKI